MSDTVHDFMNLLPLGTTVYEIEWSRDGQTLFAYFANIPDGIPLHFRYGEGVARGWYLCDPHESRVFEYQIAGGKVRDARLVMQYRMLSPGVVQREPL